MKVETDQATSGLSRLTWDSEEAATIFVGRNGTSHCAGVEVMNLPGIIDLQPITSKGIAGNCHINIPLAAIPALCKELKRVAASGGKG